MSRHGPKYFSGGGREGHSPIRIKGRNRPVLTVEQATLAEGKAAAKRKRKAGLRLSTITKQSTEKATKATEVEVAPLEEFSPSDIPVGFGPDEGAGEP